MWRAIIRLGDRTEQKISLLQNMDQLEAERLNDCSLDTRMPEPIDVAIMEVALGHAVSNEEPSSPLSNCYVAVMAFVRGHGEATGRSRVLINRGCDG